MNLPIRIAWRYFLSRRKGGGFNAVSLISWISLSGYLVGAAALLIVLSVFNGFGDLFGKMYAHFDADIRIQAAEGKVFAAGSINPNSFQGIEGIANAEFLLEENVLLRYNNRQGIATIRAVSANYIQHAHLDTNILRGEPLLESGDTFFAMIGMGIAYQLGIDPADPYLKLGIFMPRDGEIQVTNPDGAFAKAYINPSAIFSVQEEVDNKFLLIPYRFASENLERGNVYSACDIRLKSGSNMNQVQEQLQEKLGNDFVVLNRFEQRASFYKIMQSEKIISYFILVFILLIAAFNTIGSLYMLVLEKRQDLSILSGMGFKSRQLFSLFVWEGLIIAIIGGLSGILLGLFVVWGQSHYGWVGLQNAESFIISAYPVKLIWTDVVAVFFTLLVLGVITAVYPALRAARQ